MPAYLVAALRRMIDYQSMETTAKISGYYARGGEVDRLHVGRGRVVTGVHEPFDQDLFTLAYFHHPDEIVGEFADAGLTRAARYALEGPHQLAEGVAFRRHPAPGTAPALTGPTGRVCPS